MMEFFFYAGPEVMIKHNTFEKVLIGNNEVKKISVEVSLRY